MQEIQDELKKEKSPVMISGCLDTQKVHLSEAIAKDFKFKVIVTYDEARARQILDDCLFFDKSAVYYPAKDFIFYSANIHGNQLISQRIKCISRIADTLKGINGTHIESYGNRNNDKYVQADQAQQGDNAAGKDSKNSLTIVTTIDAFADILVPVERYEKNAIEFMRDGIINLEELKRKLIACGYIRTGMVENPGEFAIRGGIIDIFSFVEETPVRIELWDDEIDTMKIFDAASQRSIEKISYYRVFPATECLLSEEEKEDGLKKIKKEMENQLEVLGLGKRKKDAAVLETCNRLRQSIADIENSKSYEKCINSFSKELSDFAGYFPKDSTLFIFDEPDSMSERMKLVEYEYSESMKNRIAGGYILPSQAQLMRSTADIYNKIESGHLLMLSTLDYRPKIIKAEYNHSIMVKSISSYNNSFEYLADDLKKYKRNGYRAILVCNSRTRASRIVSDLDDYGLESYFSEDFEKEILPGTVMVTYGNIHKGFEYPEIKFVVIAENDIFTSKRQKRTHKKKYEGKSISGFNELSIGDYVVHESHGLGIYKGIEKIRVEGVEKDYIKIEYGDNSNLFVLATQLDRLQKYAAADTDKKPKLNKLGGQEWNKTKSKVHTAVEEVAKDLVELYAVRQQKTGFQFGPDTVWQREFEEMFPYEETKDQLNAIEDTKTDMQSKRVMDRLVCGDVGYGKTEVAIRAAFKAVQDGKQVAYLVPTTILAQQHYSTFMHRMKNFPVNVSQLSSFRTASQIKETIKGLKNGMVDIVIGTHRLLSKDVQFKDLGLLIIDEEQRFGVTHKEKIKKLKNDIDVLTLSATPIPRTLHMSLVGIRDMSVLEEPPVDRVPIQTFVTEHNDEMIREAINRELARKGQVYYVYNKVRNIDEAAAHIKQLVPDANVEFAHGQMDKRQLEKIMFDFINGEIDVLVSTTIIETGMDISNVNTMIIEDADKFGLSQLYQLRGRVGRSNRTAYAFLLYRRNGMLSEVAQKRLSAIREFSDLGSGFKIAMKDLEIRGAGNVLGKSQHGHMAAVGYDLYCKMLNQAVNELKGIKNEYAFETNVDLDVDAYIPSMYIKNEYQKLDIYKRIASISSEEELADMSDELMDRYGSIPDCAANLLQIALIKAIAHKIGITEVKGGLDTSVFPSVYRTFLKISPKAEIKSEKIPEFVDSFGGAMTFKVNTDPVFTWKVTKKKFSNAKEYLEGLKHMLEVMCSTML